jgi:RHS repeat-associated protein
VKKTEGGQTILYINQYYEKNLTTGVITTSYYLGGQLVANRVGTTLTYIHQDCLSSTSVMTTSTGTLDSSITFFPFGLTRTGSVSTAKKFTGQRLDGTGLYYYNARYYDASIGRFISPDSTGQKLNDPQSLNRYTYCGNNPLKYTDPTGHDQVIITNDDGTFTIMDGEGDYLGTATDIDDLAVKMKECEVKSRDVDLPLGKDASDFIDAITGQVKTPEPSLPSLAIQTPETPNSILVTDAIDANKGNNTTVHTGWGWFLFKVFETVDIQIPTGLIVSACLIGTVACPVAGIILVPVAAAAIWCDVIIVKNEWKDFRW